MTAAPDSSPTGFELSPGDTNQNPQGLGLWKLIAEDWHTHGRRITAHGFWALAIHRFGNWRMSIRTKPLRAPFTLIYRFLFAFSEWVIGIHLPYTTRVGRRVRIEHFAGIFLVAREIGDDCVLRQHTTLGALDDARIGQYPILGKHVEVGCGVAILGPVRIGDHASIGANAVVVRDIPAHAVAVGVPARVIKHKQP
ncbi:MAG: serine acetyltransferase [Phycisphaeraceae bacterium]